MDWYSACSRKDLNWTFILTNFVTTKHMKNKATINTQAITYCFNNKYNNLKGPIRWAELAQLAELARLTGMSFSLRLHGNSIPGQV